jgi:hypothetical protein
LDDDGLIRIKSRIQHCGDSELANPIFLPDCAEARLFIHHQHKRILHGGPKATLTKIRERFWIPKGLLVVRKSISKCRACLRYKARPYCLPAMPNLPSSRVKEFSPFAFCGIDAAGPWSIKGKDEHKKWILLITCLTTRAVFLEVLEDMSAKCCINAIIRFMGTFNTPKQFLSDHGSNFKAASKLIIQWQKVIHDPWKGGVYERLIGIMKNCLKFAFGRRKMLAEDFHTVVKQIQGIMNSRPIVDVDPEKQPLRPIDFLIPNAKLTVPEMEDPDDPKDPEYLPQLSTADKLRANFKQINECLNKYWDRWQKEYLSQLRDTCATLHKQKGLDVRPEIDDVVLIEEEELVPRGSWRLGRIVEVKESSDGKIRQASVKVGNGNILNRSPSHLYPLEANLEPKTSSRPKPTISPLYLTVVMLICLPMINAYPVISQAICTADNMMINVTDVAKMVVRFPHRTKDFTVNSTQFNITLPLEIAIAGGPVNLIGYSKEGIFVQQETICETHDDYCKMIDCNWCFRKLINFECWHWLLWILIALIFLLITLGLSKLCKKSKKKSLFAAGAARLFNIVKRSNKHEESDLEMDPIPRPKVCLTCKAGPYKRDEAVEKPDPFKKQRKTNSSRKINKIYAKNFSSFNTCCYDRLGLHSSN